jgi:hypothetical protein
VLVLKIVVMLEDRAFRLRAGALLEAGAPATPGDKEGSQELVPPRLLMLATRSPVIPSEYASRARTEESLTILRSLDFARDDKGAESIDC